jgi:hypothetical protein
MRLFRRLLLRRGWKLGGRARVSQLFWSEGKPTSQQQGCGAPAFALRFRPGPPSLTRTPKLKASIRCPERAPTVSKKSLDLS